MTEPDRQSLLDAMRERGLSPLVDALLDGDECYDSHGRLNSVATCYKMGIERLQLHAMLEQARQIFLEMCVD